MIDPDTRNAMVKLHQEGMSLREISRRLEVSRLQTLVLTTGSTGRP